MPNLACLDRELELSQLVAAVEAARAGQGGVRFISGQVGSGKSTLVAELAQHRLPEGIEVAFGHCDQEGVRAGALLPWRELLADLTDLAEVEAVGVGFAAKARESLSSLAPDLVELLVPGIGLVMRSAKLLGQNTSFGRRFSTSVADGRSELPDLFEAERSQLADRYLNVLENLARDKPLLLLLEDIHWADPGSLQLLTTFAQRARNSRMLAVCTFRPNNTGASVDEFRQLIQAVEIGQGNRETLIDLDANRHGAQARFVNAYLGFHTPGVASEFAESLARHTDGVPLLVNGLVEHLIEQQQLVQTTGGWQVVAELDWANIPANIESVLADQLRLLDPQLRDLLAIASVEGETFTAEVVAAIAGQSNLAVVRSLTRGLQAHPDLYEALGTSRLGAHRVARYRFRHGLTQRYLASGIDATELQYLHESIANTLESLAGDQREDIASHLAFHFDRGGRGELAWTHYEVAAQQAEASCAQELAAQQVDRALELVPPGLQADRTRLHQYAAELALGAGGRLAKAHQQVLQAFELLNQHTTAMSPAGNGLYKTLTHILIEKNELDEAEQMIRSRLHQLSNPIDVVDLEMLRALRTLHNRRGESEEALKIQLQVHDAAAEAGYANEVLESQDLAELGWCYKEVGRNVQAREAFEKSLAIQHRLTTPNWATLGQTHYAFGDLLLNEEIYPEARSQFEKAMEYWGKFDRQYLVGIALNALANLENREQNYAEALDHARRAERVTGAIVGSEHLELGFPITCAGEAYLGLKQYRSAIRALERALSIRERGSARQGNLAWTQWLLGRAYCESSLDVERGRALVQQARQTLAAMGDVARSEVSDIDHWLQQQADG